MGNKKSTEQQTSATGDDGPKQECGKCPVHCPRISEDTDDKSREIKQTMERKMAYVYLQDDYLKSCIDDLLKGLGLKLKYISRDYLQTIDEHDKRKFDDETATIILVRHASSRLDSAIEGCLRYIADKSGKEVQQCQDRWIKYKRSCYFISEDEMAFDRARANCQKLQADLVHIDNADENTFLTNHLSTLKGISFWIGLTYAVREGDFKWVDDNSRVSFSEWSPSQPDDSGNKEDCTHIYAKWNFKWNDLNCLTPAKYICEEKIT